MRILWAKSDFLHPTERGGQIRTLEMLRQLHRRHEIHFVAFDHPWFAEGPTRAVEYSSYNYPISLRLPLMGSPAFFLQVAGSVFSRLPLSISRYGSAAMRRKIVELLSQHKFDAVVCDFLAPAHNLPDLTRCVLFQHNVETLVWRRHASTERRLLRRLFLRREAARAFRHEGAVCRAVKHVVTVSPNDSESISQLFGRTEGVSVVPTGVDCDFFKPREPVTPTYDLLFLGSMDYLPNVNGMLYFVQEIWPRICQSHPTCSLGIVGRAPFPEVRRLAESDSRIHVTGTVPDVRPYVWGSRVSIVPLQVGGGTRLKIYESMAAGVPVVSTAVGAEGLNVPSPAYIRIADTPETFAEQCSQFLANDTERREMAANAQCWVAENYSWDNSARCFERILETA